MLEEIGLSREDSTDCADGGVEHGFVCVIGIVKNLSGCPEDECV